MFGVGFRSIWDFSLSNGCSLSSELQVTLSHSTQTYMIRPFLKKKSIFPLNFTFFDLPITSLYVGSN